MLKKIKTKKQKAENITILQEEKCAGGGHGRASRNHTREAMRSLSGMLQDPRIYTEAQRMGERVLRGKQQRGQGKGEERETTEERPEMPCVRRIRAIPSAGTRRPSIGQDASAMVLRPTLSAQGGSGKMCKHEADHRRVDRHAPSIHQATLRKSKR